MSTEATTTATTAGLRDALAMAMHAVAVDHGHDDLIAGSSHRFADAVLTVLSQTRKVIVDTEDVLNVISDSSSPEAWPARGRLAAAVVAAVTMGGKDQ